MSGGPAHAPFDAARFQERFRGSEEEIRARLAGYFDLLPPPPGEILDFGCGRGEFLDLARARGLPARGVDLLEANAARCRAKGHAAQAADGFEALAAAADAGLGGLAAIQVIEHLDFAAQCALLLLAARKLAPGGFLLLETPNPYQEDARRRFWLDPTHQRPLAPELLDFLAEQAGFPRREIHYPGERALLLQRERRRQRSAWERLIGRRSTRRPVAAPARLLDPADGMRFPDYALLAWR